MGTVHPVVNEFKLVTFLNISALDTNHNDIVAFHKQLELFCKRYSWVHQSTAVLSSCEWLKSSTTSIFHQIEQVKGEILGSLDSNYQSTRVRRGLFNAVGRVSKVLFGVCSDEDAEFLNSKISELSNARTDTLNILEAQTRIVRATVNDINSTLTTISKERKNMGDLITHLSEKLGKSLSTLSELDAREMLSEQKLLQIVNSAIHGQAHPSLMTHQQYVEHLREIQLTLPIGSNLPFPLEKFSITKFIQVTQVSVLLASNALIFIQTIPLISSNLYKGYRLIPFPVRQQGQTYSILTSVPSVLALSSNREYFIPLTESQLGNCKRNDTSFYCSQIMCMYSSTNTICGVNSLLGLKENSSVFKVQYVKINNSIFSRLESTNTWLYVSVSENVAIKCVNEDPHNIILNETGQITLNPQCVLYAKQTILFPSQVIVRNSSRNLYNPIKSEGLGHLLVTNISQDLVEALNFSESHNSIGLEDLSRHSKSLKEIEEMIKVEKNKNYTPKETHIKGLVEETDVRSGRSRQKIAEEEDRARQAVDRRHGLPDDDEN
ncbi:uncharacterized protein LOC132945649 [Metopolophium dirhodum]|uniref:uncharacterized protein LOC132945649 n=1 Tax=Metopolophium dirhodum TaxID=44670 RepID=UPI002990780E|nr:uncharacterized protein LOC132945649 [Metopolophium dirhodum]